MTARIGRLVAVDLPGWTPPPTGSPFRREVEVAIRDLVAENRFGPANGTASTYRLKLTTGEERIVFDISDETGGSVGRPSLPLAPLRRLIKDYLMMCEVHREALAAGQRERIEAIDMGRRGLHNEGGDMLRDMLEAAVDIDHPTARRLFTLISALEMRL